MTPLPDGNIGVLYEPDDGSANISSLAVHIKDAPQADSEHAEMGQVDRGCKKGEVGGDLGSPADPEDWTGVGTEGQVLDGAPILVRAQDVPIMLMRDRGVIVALADRCTHRGGPLRYFHQEAVDRQRQ